MATYKSTVLSGSGRGTRPRTRVLLRFDFSIAIGSCWGILGTFSERLERNLFDDHVAKATEGLATRAPACEFDSLPLAVFDLAGSDVRSLH